VTENKFWGGDWRGDFESLKFGKLTASPNTNGTGESTAEEDASVDAVHSGDFDSEEESEPPEFDLRTGRYVSHSRPMRKTMVSTPINSSSPSMPQETASKALARRAKLDLATINGAVSPGAEYLRTQRTWTGLGSDFNDAEASESIEEGRSGVARGYTVGEDAERR